MFDAQRSKQPEHDRSQAAPAQETSKTKQHTGDLTRIPLYTQLAWGNQPPPWLRLPVQQKEPHEEEAVKEENEPTQRKENTTGLPDTLKAGVESLSGLSMDDVQVHYNSAKPAEVQALAYTQGTEIHVGPGQEKHLAHEAWHVVQQKQERVMPMLQMQEMAINDDQRLEKAADVMGTKASTEPSTKGPLNRLMETSDEAWVRSNNVGMKSIRSQSPLVSGSTPTVVRFPIQRKFAGSLGLLLDLLDPAKLNVTGSLYATFWNEVKNSQEVVMIEEAGVHSYSQEKKTIYFREFALKMLREDAYTNQKLPLELKASLLSSITHELSHAHDHLIQKRVIRPEQQGPEEHALDVLDTELRAWAREAITAHQISPQKLDKGQSELIEGWRLVTEAMFDDIATSRKNNAVMMRLFDYTRRTLRENDVKYIQPFLTKHKAKLWGDIFKFHGTVVKFTP